MLVFFRVRSVEIVLRRWELLADIRWSFASPVETWARTWLDVGERRRGRHSGPVPLVSSPGLDLVVLRHPSPPGLDLGIRLSVCF